MIVVRLNSPRPSCALRLERLFRRRIQSAPERQIRESLLSHVAVFVFFVRAERVQRAYAEYADECAEDVSLLEIDLHQVCRFLLDIFYRFANVGNSQFRREWNLSVKPLGIKRQESLLNGSALWYLLSEQ